MNIMNYCPRCKKYIPISTSHIAIQNGFYCYLCGRVFINYPEINPEFLNKNYNDTTKTI